MGWLTGLKKRNACLQTLKTGRNLAMVNWTRTTSPLTEKKKYNEKKKPQLIASCGPHEVRRQSGLGEKRKLRNPTQNRAKTMSSVLGSRFCRKTGSLNIALEEGEIHGGEKCTTIKV